MTGPHREPVLHVSDRAVASIAAHLAATTPGVARLHPALVRALTRTATAALRHHIQTANTTSTAEPGTAQPGTADPAAVLVEAPSNRDGPRVVSVRIIATGQPPVIDTAITLQHRIHDQLRRITGQDTDIRVFVAALDPPPPNPAVTGPTQPVP